MLDDIGTRQQGVEVGASPPAQLVALVEIGPGRRHGAVADRAEPSRQSDPGGGLGVQSLAGVESLPFGLPFAHAVGDRVRVGA